MAAHVIRNFASASCIISDMVANDQSAFHDFLSAKSSLSSFRLLHRRIGLAELEGAFATLLDSIAHARFSHIRQLYRLISATKEASFELFSSGGHVIRNFSGSTLQRKAMSSRKESQAPRSYHPESTPSGSSSASRSGWPSSRWSRALPSSRWERLRASSPPSSRSTTSWSSSDWESP